MDSNLATFLIRCCWFSSRFLVLWEVDSAYKTQCYRMAWGKNAGPSTEDIKWKWSISLRLWATLSSPAPSPWEKDFINERAVYPSISNGVSNLIPTLSFVSMPCVLLCHLCWSLEQQGGTPCRPPLGRSGFCSWSAKCHHINLALTSNVHHQDFFGGQKRQHKHKVRGPEGSPGMLGTRKYDFLMLTERLLGVSNVRMLIGWYWGQRPGTRITFGYMDLNLTLGPHCKLESTPAG